jgi:hypothetical protein
MFRIGTRKNFVSCLIFNVRDLNPPDHSYNTLTRLGELVSFVNDKHTNHSNWTIKIFHMAAIWPPLTIKFYFISNLVNIIAVTTADSL